MLFIKYILLTFANLTFPPRIVELPLVILLEVFPVLVDALCNPPRLEFCLLARASRGPPWVELVYTKFNVDSNPSTSFTSF